MSSESEVQLYTIAQVAELLGLSTRTIYRWIKAGRLPIVRLGRRVRIRHGDVVAFIEANQERHTPDEA
jgi:excisionase family DNA binding protein